MGSPDSAKYWHYSCPSILCIARSLRTWRRVKQSQQHFPKFITETSAGLLDKSEEGIGIKLKTKNNLLREISAAGGRRCVWEFFFQWRISGKEKQKASYFEIDVAIMDIFFLKKLVLVVMLSEWLQWERRDWNKWCKSSNFNLYSSKIRSYLLRMCTYSETTISQWQGILHTLVIVSIKSCSEWVGKNKYAGWCEFRRRRQPSLETHESWSVLVSGSMELSGGNGGWNMPDKSIEKGPDECHLQRKMQGMWTGIHWWKIPIAQNYEKSILASNVAEPKMKGMDLHFILSRGTGRREKWKSRFKANEHQYLALFGTEWGKKKDSRRSQE